MELVQELFVTAFVALLFSFVVAKLVSIAIAGGDDGRNLGSKSSESPHKVTFMEEVKFDGGLTVQSTESSRGVQFVEEAVEKVDKFEGEGSVDNSEELCCREEFGEKRCDSAVVSDADNRIKEREVSDSEVVGFSEKSSEGAFREEDVSAEVVGANEVERTKEKDIVTGLDGLADEESSKRKKADEFDGVKEEYPMTGSVVEEKIAGNVKIDDVIVLASVVSGDVIVSQGEEVRDVDSGENQGIGIEGELNREHEKEELVGDEEEDDWEGIERSELDETFAAAANYVACGKDDRLSGSDAQMQLYGLHKVAMEGPCHEPRPMALKVSARAKWNAWQNLGNMSPEVAMEQYITLLSEKVPGWMEGKSSGDDNEDSLESGISDPPYPDISTHLHNQLNFTKESELELKSGTDGGDLTGSSNFVDKE